MEIVLLDSQSPHIKSVIPRVCPQHNLEHKELAVDVIDQDTQHKFVCISDEVNKNTKTPRVWIPTSKKMKEWEQLHCYTQKLNLKV